MRAQANADKSIVSIWADGKKTVTSTEVSTVEEVLAREGIDLEQGDLVEPAAQTRVEPGYFNVNVYRARPVAVIDGRQTYHLRSAYSNPRLIAKAAGLKLNPEDAFETGVTTGGFLDAQAIGVAVTVRRAVPFTVRVDGIRRAFRAQPTTVGQALAANNVSMGPKDTVSVPLSAPLTANMTIAITRVSDVVVTAKEKLPRPVRRVEDPNSPKGETKVKSEGADGHQTVTYRVHYRDGIESSRQKLAVTGRVEPKEKVLVVGTKVRYAGSVEYWRPYIEEAAKKHGVDVNKMMRIMQCESNGNALVVSKFEVGAARENPTGLFQYLPSTWERSIERFGNGNEDIFDGQAQIRITAAKFAEDGSGEWACR